MQLHRDPRRVVITAMMPLDARRRIPGNEGYLRGAGVRVRALTDPRLRLWASVIGALVGPGICGAVASAMLLEMLMLAGGLQPSFRGLFSGAGFELRVSPAGTLPLETDATLQDADRLWMRPPPSGALRQSRRDSSRTPRIRE